MEYDYLIVGAGLYGSVFAERLANEEGAKALVIDKREHIGGNCYSKRDEETDIEYHVYGPHIFHTSSERVWKYISRFTEFNSYHHQTLTTHKGKVYQMPINLETINSFYNINLRPYEVEDFLAKEAAKANITKPKNFEKKAISLSGRPLYEAFIRGYARKQWGKDPKNLPVSILKRLAIRSNYDENYFHDCRWQGIPLNGYAEIFEKMLSSKNITVKLNCDFFKHRHEFKVRKKTIYTGPIDRYFDYKHGRLEWRTIELERKVVNYDDFQGDAIMNYADEDVKHARILEPKYCHPERKHIKGKSLIFYERSLSDPENPYYSVNSMENRAVFKKYRQLAEKEEDLIIGGRLGDYAYYNMDKTILAALNCYQIIHHEEYQEKAATVVKNRVKSALAWADKSLYILMTSARMVVLDLLRRHAPHSSQKNLYVSCVGKYGKHYLKAIIERFGHETFDYLIMVYDDAEFNEEIFAKCRFIREKGLKWQLIKKHVPGSLGQKYRHIFLWDDDVDIENFSVLNFLDIMERNALDIAQPALKLKSFFSHFITLKDYRYKVGRRTDFVEVMIPVVRGTQWSKFYYMIEKDYNYWGWGYDLYLLSKCGFHRVGIIDQEAVYHTRSVRGRQIDNVSDFNRFVRENQKFKHAKLVRLGALK